MAIFNSYVKLPEGNKLIGVKQEFSKDNFFELGAPPKVPMNGSHSKSPTMTNLRWEV